MGPVGIETLDQRRLAALLAAGRGLVAQLQLDAVLEELLRVACELTGAQYAALGVLGDDRRSLARFVTRGIGPAEHAAIGDLPRGRGVLGDNIVQQHGVARLAGEILAGPDGAARGIHAHHHAAGVRVREQHQALRHARPRHAVERAGHDPAIAFAADVNRFTACRAGGEPR